MPRFRGQAERRQKGCPAGLAYTVEPELSTGEPFGAAGSEEHDHLCDVLGFAGVPHGTFRWSTICCLTSSMPTPWLSAIC